MTLKLLILLNWDLTLYNYLPYRFRCYSLSENDCLSAVNCPHLAVFIVNMQVKVFMIAPDSTSCVFFNCLLTMMRESA